jgi:chromosome partitioning protein
MRVVAVTGLKGGVGKTSTAVNLAALSAGEGRRTLLWDLDPQGAATYCFALEPRLRGGAVKLLGGGRGGLLQAARGTGIERLEVVPADTSVREVERVLAVGGASLKLIRRLVKGAASDFDVLVIDCPPGLSRVVEAVAGVADVMLVPVVPEPLPLRALERFRSFLTETRAASPDLLAPFLSMVDRREPMHRRTEAVAKESGRFLEAAIPESSAVARMGEEQVPAVLSAPLSLAAEQYALLWRETKARIRL